MTGGDLITARFLYGEFFTFAPTFKVFIAANHKPVITGTDHAMWRRIRLVPFTVTIPDAEQDKTLPDKLRGELPGILRWAVEGCRHWQAQGLVPPHAVQAATEGYKSEMDTLGNFLDECCVVETRRRVAAHELYEEYTRWCQDAGVRYPLTKTTFGVRLKERGFRAKKSGNERLWRGLELRGRGVDDDDDLAA
jgi:putative DNA primase/helicase